MSVSNRDIRPSLVTCSLQDYRVGLFAPRAGQNFRDEQRRRRSQYDRGTRLAEIEDAYDYDFDHHEFKSDANPIYPISPYGRCRGYAHSGHDHY